MIYIKMVNDNPVNNIDSPLQVLEKLKKNLIIIKNATDKMKEPVKCLTCGEYLRDMDWVRMRTHLWVLEHYIEGGKI